MSGAPFLIILAGLILVGLVLWYRREVVSEGDGTVHLQSEHEQFHMHVDLPVHMEIRPGDTVEVLNMPEVPNSQTHGEMTFPSRIRLYRASWLRRNLVKSSSLLEINELVEHP